MGLGKKTIDDENYAGKRVLVRCDFNVPMKDGVITNDNRINAALPTIKKLIADGAKVILCSHLGKPKNGPEAKFSLAPVAVRLSEKLGQPVVFADDDAVVGENAKAAVAAMNNGDVVLLQNTRFRKEETKNIDAFSEELASLVRTWEQNAAGFSCGETVAGIVRSVESYGVFVELTPNLAGLAELREGISAGQHASVYIKSMIPEKMKVKLIIVDCFDAHYKPAPPDYRLTDGHISRWRYSPECCRKVLETVFDEKA